MVADSVFKLGFLYFSPLLLLENVGYTSNIYTYDAVERPDWTGDLGVGLRASAILANRLILQAEDLPHYSFYLENKDLRSWSNRFAANAYSYFGPLNLKASFARNDMRQRPNLEFSRPYRFADSEWSGEVDIGRLSRLFATVYARFSRTTYEEDAYLGGFNLDRSLSHRLNTYGLRLNQRIFTDTVIYAGYETGDYRFDFSSERDARTQAVSLGVEFPEIGVLQGGFRIGLSRLDPRNPLFRPTQRPNGRGDVQVTFSDRVRFQLFYELETLFSFGANDLFYDSQGFGGGVEVYLTRFLKAGATYDDHRLKYHSLLDLSLQRSDRVRQQRYSLAVPFFGSTSLGFAYTVYRLTSDALGLDYTRNFWGGFISYEF